MPCDMAQCRLAAHNRWESGNHYRTFFQRLFSQHPRRSFAANSKLQRISIVDTLKNSSSFVLLGQPKIHVSLDFVIVVDRQNFVAFEVNFEGLDDLASNVGHDASCFIFFTLKVQRKANEETPWRYHVVFTKIWKSNLKILPGLDRTFIIFRTLIMSQNDMLAMGFFCSCLLYTSPSPRDS